MIRFQRMNRAKVGKAVEAIQSSRDATAWLKTTFPDYPFQNYLERFGANVTLYVFADFPDVATLNRTLAQVERHAEWHAFARKAADVYAEYPHDKVLVALHEVAEAPSTRIRYQRSARAKPTTVFDASQWAVELTEWINANATAGHSQVFAERYGTTGTLHWISHYPDVATMEQATKQLLANEEYRKRAMAGAGLLEHLPQDTVLVAL